MKNMDKKIIYAVMITAIVSIFSIGKVFAQGNSGAIWTTHDDCGDITQDVNHYEKGQWVYINGANFNPGTYDWTIKGQPGNASEDPGDTVAAGQVSVDESGNFCFAAYQVQDDDGGEYKVKVGNKGDNYRVKIGTPSVSIEVGECNLQEGRDTQRIVYLNIIGASLTINGQTYTSSQSIYLSPGTYDYSWTALPGYKGSGSGTIFINSCEEEEKSSVSFELGSCELGNNNKSYRMLSLEIENATFTINGEAYMESTQVKLSPGVYPYQILFVSGELQEGTLEVKATEACTPEQSSTPTPTVAPVTGSLSGPGVLMITGTGSLLISLASFILWKKRG